MTVYKDGNLIVQIHTRTNIPDSDFADPTNRTYPIIDENHVRSAMQSAMWQLAHLNGTGREKLANGQEKREYLQDVHDHILERAKQFHMNLQHECELCKVKVKFT
jgi:hypothetical protein